MLGSAAVPYFAGVMAERAGTVTEIKVKPGDTVGAGDIVIIVE